VKLQLDSARLLVVEDHPFQRSMLVAILRSLGVRQIAEAANGREALTSLTKVGASSIPDVIICDLEMPEMDGIEFLRAVAERKLARGVVIASGREPDILRGVEAMARASSLAVLAKLQKPIMPAQMKQALAGDLPERPGAASEGKAIDPALLRRAIAERQFEAVFQPKVQLATRAFCGVEALARWTPPGFDAVSPLAFVPALTREGLISALTDSMLAQSCEALKTWRGHGLTPGVSVNLSMATLVDLEVADRFADHVAQLGISPQRVTLEVTETEVMADAPRVLNVLSRLRLKGFQLAIDDFGTGYSSLQQLNTLPFTELKVDQSFVRDCGKSRRQRDIVEASVDLARHLGMHTVAEGVESQTEWDFLASKRCEEAQGYFISRPISAAAIPVWASEWARRSAGTWGPR
jgi:EAL domain-containing protein (putative c-di-GMP-specific phosphodiesterase class I)/CheY-like chemotaxis protein